jgi:hypothetical protein
MANNKVTDHNWHDIRYEHLPDWVKNRVKELYRRELRGKTFIYRRDRRTGRYQRKLRDYIEIETPRFQQREANKTMSQRRRTQPIGASAAEKMPGESEVRPDTIIPSFLKTFAESALAWFDDRLDKWLGKRAVMLTAICTLMALSVAIWAWVEAHIGWPRHGAYVLLSIAAWCIGALGLVVLVRRFLLAVRTAERVEHKGLADKLDEWLNNKALLFAVFSTITGFSIGIWAWFKFDGGLGGKGGPSYAHLALAIVACCLAGISVVLVILRLWLNITIVKLNVEQQKANIISMIDDALRTKGGDEK